MVLTNNEALYKRMKHETMVLIVMFGKDLLLEQSK